MWWGEWLFAAVVAAAVVWIAFVLLNWWRIEEQLRKELERHWE